MKITITNYKELIEFISREDISDENARKVTDKALNIFCMDEIKNRAVFVQQVKDFIIKYGDQIDKPLFL